MAHGPEVALAEAEQHGAVDLGVAADVVVLLGVELATVLVDPQPRVAVPQLPPHDAGVPVVVLTGVPAAPLEQQDPLAGSGEGVGEGAAASAGTDHDDVVMLGHQVSSQVIASGATQAPVAPRSLGWDRTNKNSQTRAAASSARNRFSITTTPWRVFRVCGTTKGESGTSA